MLQILDSPVESVWADLKHTVTAGDADDFLKVIIRGETGRLLEVEQSYACAFPQPKWLVCGLHGTMRIDGGEAKIKYFDPKKAPKLRVDTKAPPERKYGNDDRLPWKTKTLKATPKRKYPDFYDNLSKAVRRGNRLLVTPESVRETISVLDQAREASLWK